MRIVVIGGTGLVGSKLVHALTEHGHDAVAAAPSTGVNTLTGEGLPEVLEGASVVVDVSNSPTLDDAAMEFFRTATTNLLTAEKDAGIGHHVALSVVGTDRLAPRSGYFRAKLAQEKLISDGPIPYSSCTPRSSSSSSGPSPIPRPSTTRCARRRRSSSRWPLPMSRKGSLSPRSVTR